MSTPCSVCIEAKVADHCYHRDGAPALAKALASYFETKGPYASLGWIDDADDICGAIGDDGEAPFRVEPSGLTPPESRGSIYTSFYVNDWLVFVESDEENIIHLIGKRESQS